MSLYTDYLDEIGTRKAQGLNPKPIDDGALVAELIAHIREAGNAYRDDSLKYFIYNTLPGTTSAAGVKAAFLKEIILGAAVVAEITPEFAFELLSHMKGGPSVQVLLDLALGDDAAIAEQAAEVLKTQVFLYEADTDRLEIALQGRQCRSLQGHSRKLCQGGVLHQAARRSTRRSRSSPISPPRAISPPTCSRPETRRIPAPTASCTANA